MLAIEIYGSPLLRAENKDIIRFDQELADLIKEMFETMREAKGVGLAAPQVGLNYNLFVTHAPEDEKRVFINPHILSSSVETVSLEEGCLSLPGIWARVDRPKKVVVQAKDLKGDSFTLKVSGFLARVIQHEYDHLQGRLFTDYADDKVRAKADKKFLKKNR